MGARLPGIVELVGFALLVIAAFLTSLALGFAAAGAGLVLWALTLDRRGPPPGEEAP